MHVLSSVVRSEHDEFHWNIICSLGCFCNLYEMFFFLFISLLNRFIHFDLLFRFSHSSHHWMISVVRLAEKKKLHLNYFTIVCVLDVLIYQQQSSYLGKPVKWMFYNNTNKPTHKSKMPNRSKTNDFFFCFKYQTRMMNAYVRNKQERSISIMISVLRFVRFYFIFFTSLFLSLSATWQIFFWSQ